jgi:hypothetical protein
VIIIIITTWKVIVKGTQHNIPTVAHTAAHKHT